jgi:methylmalonyl-CoA/ethylmalonyl-CoA epimerase
MTYPLSVAKLGPLLQLGYVTLDFEASLDFWTRKMGVGPFFRFDHVPFTGSKYKNQDSFIDISTAFAYWGDTQIEIIRQHNDAESVFKTWSDRNSVGVHHVCVQVADLEEVRSQCLTAGGAVVQEAWMEGAGHFIYVELGGQQDLVEFAQLDKSFGDLFAYMKRAARNWNGEDPIRPIPPPDHWLL